MPTASLRVMARMESDGKTIPENSKFESRRGKITIAEIEFDFSDKHELNAGLDVLQENVAKAIDKMRRSIS